MNTIKFSKTYPKLWGQKKASLIHLRILRAELVSPMLIEYDTKDINKDYYPLPKSGFLLQLIFIGEYDIPFCTLRRYTEEKKHYYQSRIGLTFNISVEMISNANN